MNETKLIISFSKPNQLKGLAQKGDIFLSSIHLGICSKSNKGNLILSREPTFFPNLLILHKNYIVTRFISSSLKNLILHNFLKLITLEFLKMDILGYNDFKQKKRVWRYVSQLYLDMFCDTRKHFRSVR